MLRMIQSVALVTLCASTTAAANAQKFLARPGQTVALGVIPTFVNYDETGGDFRLIATIAEPLGGIPIRLIARLKLGPEAQYFGPGTGGEAGYRGAADPHARRL